MMLTLAVLEILEPAPRNVRDVISSMLALRCNDSKLCSAILYVGFNANFRAWGHSH